MSTFYPEDRPDTLDTLLDKANAIITVNQESLEFIQSRRGQQVITHCQYSLHMKKPTCFHNEPKKRRMLHQPEQENEKIEIDSFLKLVTNKTTQKINDIIASWRYRGEPLTRELFSYKDYIDVRLITWDDLVRLQDAYTVLLQNYSEVFADKPKSRRAVEGVIRNLEVLQVAIGEVHAMTFDVEDSAVLEDKVQTCVTNLSEILKGLPKSEYDEQGMNVKMLDVTLREKFLNKSKEDSILQFAECRALICMGITMTKDKLFVMEPYRMSRKQFLASASGDGTIKLWNLSDNINTATFKCHTGQAHVLFSFINAGVQMLACGTDASKIELWDLSNNTHVQTLSDGNGGGAYSFSIFEKDDNTMLISGHDNGLINIWDLHEYKIITTLQGHKCTVCALVVYNRDSKLNLVSVGYHECIKIWCLTDNTLITNIKKAGRNINLVEVINDGSNQILAGGNSKGWIKLWNLENYICIRVFRTEASYIPICPLSALKYGGKLCLISLRFGIVVLWDL